jgi:hypothetical protein
MLGLDMLVLSMLVAIGPAHAVTGACGRAAGPMAFAPVLGPTGAARSSRAQHIPPIMIRFPGAATHQTRSWRCPQHRRGSSLLASSRDSTPGKLIRVVGAVVIREGTVFMAQRPLDKVGFRV